MKEKWKIEVLTPVAILDGEETDGIVRLGPPDRIFIPDIFSFLKKYSEEAKMLHSIEEFSKKAVEKGYTAYALGISSSTGNFFIKNIKTFIKNPYYQPYIPGSSLKGSIRTAILYELCKKNPDIFEGLVEKLLRKENIKPTHADDEIEKEFMGKKGEKNFPHFDFLKSLRIKDSEYLDISTLKLYCVRVYSLQKNGVMKRKFPNYVEALPPGTVFTTEIQWEEYYFKEESLKELGFKNKKYLREELFKIINKFSEEIIKREMKFIGSTKYFKNMNKEKVLNFLKNLEKEIKILENNGCILQIGWGTGWFSKTVGMLLRDDLIKEIRRKFKLRGKGPIYPKTRRYAMVKENEGYPLGWIKIEKIEEVRDE